MSANTQTISITSADGTWDTITATVTVLDDILASVDTMSFKIEEFKYDAESRTLFGYLALEAPSNGEPNYPRRVHLYRGDEDIPRVKSDDDLKITSWPESHESGETYMRYIDTTTTPQAIHIRLYPTRKLRDFWFAMYRSVRVTSNHE